MKIKLLDKLIKASIKKIEEHLIIKCHLEQKLEMLNVSLQRLIDELENEQIAASRDLDFAYNFSNYCHHSLNRQKIIKEEITSTEDILENTKEKLLEISIEKKQYEFLLSKIKGPATKKKAKRPNPMGKKSEVKILKRGITSSEFSCRFDIF